MLITWITGWGILPESLRSLAEQFAPDAEHIFLPPLPSSAESVHHSPCLVGWSLGAWRILDAASRGWQFQGRVILLAPFLAFCSDYGRGGRASLTQVRWLRRWLQREPIPALQDFYLRAGLGQPPTELPYPLNDLLEGLDRLADDASPALRDFAARGLPANWRALVGTADPLLDAQAVCQTLSGCELVTEAHHRPAELLAAVQDESHAL